MWIKISIIIIILLFLIIFYKYTNQILDKIDNKELKKTNENDIPIDIESLINVTYKDLSGYTGSKNDKYNVTYGEITIDGIDNIVKYMDKNNIEKDIFIDLGCGIGKSLYMAILKGFTEAIGTEIVKERYDIALKVSKKINNKNIKIYNKDLFRWKELKKLKKNKQYCIFVSNLLFENELNNNMFEMFKILPKNTIIIVSKEPKKMEHIKMETNLDVPMTWNKKAKCIIYRII
jgi:hypothetical protein